MFKPLKSYVSQFDCDNVGLGETLRKAMDKIQGAATIDKEVVKEVIKEIQRALISANVDTTTVFALSKKIEDNAFGEIKGQLSRREYVTKVTYDALVETLGGKKAPEEPKRILLCGLFGSGKCVHPETIIPAPDGTVLTIENVYNKNKEKGVKGITLIAIKDLHNML